VIYLTTGGNGAGKTLFTLYDVRKQQVAENRPVYYHGFTAGEQLREWGWQEFNPKEWQDLPDGSICIFDECQNEFPAKIQGELPDYVNAVAQHRRRRGFDFWMITPHPSLIHVNIRRLIESPSWHRHMKRTFGGDMVSELKFNHAETSCEKPGAGDKGQVTMRAFPKEVYSWYQSASLHTGKRRLPKQVWMLGAAVLGAALFAFFGYRYFKSNLGVDESARPTAEIFQGGGAQARAVELPRRPLTLTEYLNQGTPRVPGMVHTAPRYDALTRPVRVPRPVSCLKFADNPCECTNQQGTRLVMTEETCMGIIRNGGVFADWDTNPKRARDSDYRYEDYYRTDSRIDAARTSVYDLTETDDRKPTKDIPVSTAKKKPKSLSQAEEAARLEAVRKAELEAVTSDRNSNRNGTQLKPGWKFKPKARSQAEYVAGLDAARRAEFEALLRAEEADRLEKQRLSSEDYAARLAERRKSAEKVSAEFARQDRTSIVHDHLEDIKPPIPIYPRSSQKNGEQGRVLLHVSISPEGEAIDVAVRESSGYKSLDEAAINAVRGARFKPRVENGIAYPSQADVPIDFVLKK